MKKKRLKSELQQLADNNPEIVQAMVEDGSKAKEAANRWTDNVFNIKSYVSKTFGIGSDDFDKNFEIPENFDFVQ